MQYNNTKTSPPLLGERGVLWLLLAMLFLLTFWRYLYTGFTDHDTADLAIHAWYGEGVMAYARELAVKQGRLYMLMSIPLRAVSVLLPSFFWMKLVATMSIALNALVWYWTVRRLSDSRSAALLALCAWMAFVPHSPNHSLLTGYYPSFHINLALLMSFWVCFDAWLREGRRLHLYLSLALAAYVFRGEGMVAYLATVPLMALWRTNEPRLIRRCLVAAARCWPIAAAWLVMFVPLLIFRWMNPTQYGGNMATLANLRPTPYLQTLWTYTISLFPGWLWAMDDHYAQLFDWFCASPRSAGMLRQIVHAFQVEWAARALIIAFLMYKAMRSGLRASILWLAVPAGLLLLFLAQTMLSVSAHYQDVALRGRRVLTHYGYFASFGMALCMCWPAFAAALLSRRYPRRLAATVTCLVVAIFMGGLSIIVDFTNEQVTASDRLLHQRWRTLDHFFETEAFARIPENSILYAPDLWKPVFNIYQPYTSFSGAHLVERKPDEPNYWGKYAYVRTGKTVTITNDLACLEEAFLAPTSPQIWALLYRQDHQLPRQFLALAPLRELPAREMPLYTDEFVLLPWGANRQFQVHFNTRAPDVRVEHGGKTFCVDGGYVVVDVNMINESALMPEIEIKSAGIALDSVTLSGFADVSPTAALCP